MSKDYEIGKLIDKTSFSLEYNNNQILSPLSFYEIVRHKYNTWLFTSYEYNPISSEVINLANAKEELLAVFSSWCEANLNSYLRSLYVMKQDYDILNTYKKEIEGIITLEKHKGSKESHSLNEILEMAKGTKESTSISDTIELEKGTKESTSIEDTVELERGTKETIKENTVTTPTVSSKDTSYVNGFDSANAVQSGYNVNEVLSGNVTVSKDSENNYIENSGTDTTTRTASADSNYKEYSGTDTTTRTASADDNYKEYSGKDTNTRTASADDNYTVFSDISESIFDKDVKKFDDYIESGYTTNPVNNLRTELEARMNDLVSKVVSMFIKEMCFYVD